MLVPKVNIFKDHIFWFSCFQFSVVKLCYEVLCESAWNEIKQIPIWPYPHFIWWLMKQLSGMSWCSVWNCALSKSPHLLDEESEVQRKRVNGKYSILEARSPGSLIHDPVITHVHNPNESCQLSNLLCRPLGII